MQTQHDGLAVTGCKRAVGVNGGVAGTGARRRRRAVKGVVQRVTHPLGQRLQHRHIDALALAGLLAVHERGQDVGVRVHAGSNVGHRVAGLGGCLGRAGDRHKTGFALNQQVVGFFVAVGAGVYRVIAVTRDVANNDAGLDFGQRFKRHTQARRRAGRQVLHHHVGFFEDQAHQYFLRFFMFDVQRQAFFGAVGPDKVRGQTFDTLVIAARKVAHAGALDLDDAGAHVGELARGKGRCNRVLQGNNGDALEGLHVCFLCPVTGTFRPGWRRRPWSASLRGPAPTGARSCRRQTARREQRKDGCQRSGAPP